PDIPFFRTARVRIAGVDVLALRHGMVGHKGVELAGAFAGGPAVRAALFEAGEKYGLTAAGRLAYFTSPIENGWMAYPLPAIYTGDKMKEFRKWLPGDSWGANLQLSGSFYSGNIEDYYKDPWELGYGSYISFDHEFIGREALERAAKEKHRVKVTLVWNEDDFANAFKSLAMPGASGKLIKLPVASYGFPQSD